MTLIGGGGGGGGDSCCGGDVAVTPESGQEEITESGACGLRCGEGHRFRDAEEGGSSASLRC